MDKDSAKFVGTWVLRRMEMSRGDGKKEYTYGDNPLGYITYTPDGFVHAILMSRARLALGISLEELSAKSPLQRLLALLLNPAFLLRCVQALLMSTAYVGSWSLNGAEVRHSVHAAVVPDWIGVDLFRSYRFQDDYLHLDAHYDNGDCLALTWQRV